MKNKKVYIILLNYNGWQDTIECLESVLKNDYKHYQVIVVDNSSVNNSMEYIINWAEGKQEIYYNETSKLKHLSQPFEPKPLQYIYYSKEEALKGGDVEKELNCNNPLIFIQSGKNGGFAAGNNIGIKYALAKNDFNYIWFLNNDTVIKNNTLNVLINSYKSISKRKKIGMLGSSLLYYSNPEYIQGLGATYNPIKSVGNHNFLHNKYNELVNTQLFEVDYVIGASFIVSKQFIDDVGLLTEEYFLYFEELDFAQRGLDFNYKSFVEPKSIVYHKEGASIGSSLNKSIIKSDLSDYYLIVNKIKITKKFFKLYLLTVIPVVILMVLKRLIYKPKHAFKIIKGLF